MLLEQRTKTSAGAAALSVSSTSTLVPSSIRSRRDNSGRFRREQPSTATATDLGLGWAQLDPLTRAVKTIARKRTTQASYYLGRRARWVLFPRPQRCRLDLGIDLSGERDLVGPHVLVVGVVARDIWEPLLRENAGSYEGCSACAGLIVTLHKPGRIPVRMSSVRNFCLVQVAVQANRA